MAGGYIQVCPGANLSDPADMTAKRIVWIGKNPDYPYQYGAYFRGPVWIGGTNTGNAPVTVDSSGNVSIDGILNVGSSGACFYNGSGSYTKVWGGAMSITDSSGTSAIDMNGSPYNGITLYGGRPIYCTGTVRADLGFISAGYAGASGTFTTADGKTVTVRGGIITAIV